MNEIVPFQDIQIAAAKEFGKQTATKVFGFLADILRPPAKELGGLLADQVSFFRFKVQVNILHKAKEFHGLYGSNPQEVPLKFIADLLEHSSWEENEDMQSKWAALLANAANQGEPTTNYLTYVELLRQLTPNQALCLDFMYEEKQFPANRFVRELPSYQEASTIKSALEISDDQLHVLFDSLIRLNLIHVKLEKEAELLKFQNLNVERSYEECSLTYLGQALIKKCRIPLTEVHKTRIREICIERIEGITQQYNRELIKDLYDTANQVYEYLTENDINSAVTQSLSCFFGEDGKIIYIGDRELDPKLKTQIVELIIEKLDRIHA